MTEGKKFRKKLKKIAKHIINRCIKSYKTGLNFMMKNCINLEIFNNLLCYSWVLLMIKWVIQKSKLHLFLLFMKRLLIMRFDIKIENISKSGVSHFWIAQIYL